MRRGQRWWRRRRRLRLILQQRCPRGRPREGELCRPPLNKHASPKTRNRRGGGKRGRQFPSPPGDQRKAIPQPPWRRQCGRGECGHFGRARANESAAQYLNTHAAIFRYGVESVGHHLIKTRHNRRSASCGWLARRVGASPAGLSGVEGTKGNIMGDGTNGTTDGNKS